MIPTYVISLPNSERRAKISAELARVGITDFQFIHAQEPVKDFTMSNMRRNPRGEFGCALSHVRAIMRAVFDGVPEALFIEDDIEFCAEFTADRLLKVVRDIAPDLLYLGGHPRGRVYSTNYPGVVSIMKWSCAEAYYLDYSAMRSFLTFWTDRAGQPNAMFDFILGEFAAIMTVLSFAFYPPITQQPPGWSHIGQKFDDKRELIERGWKANLPA